MHECIVGVLWDETGRKKDRSELVTVTKFKKINKKLFRYLYKLRRMTFDRFESCPYCGKKIDWKGLRENADSQ